MRYIAQTKSDPSCTRCAKNGESLKIWYNK